MAETTPTVEPLFCEALQRHPHPFGLLRHSEADLAWLERTLLCESKESPSTAIDGKNSGE